MILILHSVNVIYHIYLFVLLHHPCIPGMNPICSWYMNLFMCNWIWFFDKFWLYFSTIFIHLFHFLHIVHNNQNFCKFYCKTVYFYQITCYNKSVGKIPYKTQGKDTGNKSGNGKRYEDHDLRKANERERQPQRADWQKAC